MKKLLTVFIIVLANQLSYSQIIYPQGGALGGALYSAAQSWMPEHGFLPGKSFPIYETVEKFDFNNKKIKITLFDDRDALKLEKLECSTVPITNKSEFAKEQGIVKVWEYINKLALDSKLDIDQNAIDLYEVRLMALDIRLIGFGSIAVHGLCQIQVKHNGTEKIYCVDLQDGDKNTPLGKSSFVSRKTATRLMMSAAIRETIEKFLKDVQTDSNPK